MAAQSNCGTYMENRVADVDLVGTVHGIDHYQDETIVQVTSRQVGVEYSDRCATVESARVSDSGNGSLWRKSFYTREIPNTTTLRTTCLRYLFFDKEPEEEPVAGFSSG